MNNVFQCERIVKKFGTMTVLDGVELCAAGGEFLLLAGTGGSGKTTLLRILAGLEAPDSGSVLLDGTDATATPPRLRRAAWLPARDTLWPHLNATENITFPLRNDGQPADAANRAAREALLTLSLEQHAARLPDELSGGERQRLALARAFAAAPRLLLLDEPFATLAPRERERLLRRVKQHAAATGAAIVAAVSDPAALLSFADRVAVLDCGKIQQDAPPLAAYRRPASRRAAGILAPATNIIEGRLLHAGAGEFVAQTPLGELRGSLANPASTPPAGTPLDILLRPECLHHDLFPPDENAFPIHAPGAGVGDDGTGGVADFNGAADGASGVGPTADFCGYHGATALRLYRTAGGVSLRVLETNPRTAAAASATSAAFSVAAPSNAAATAGFLWIAPEDLIGIPRTAP